MIDLTIFIFFSLTFILGLKVKVSITSHITVTNYHISVIVILLSENMIEVSRNK